MSFDTHEENFVTLNNRNFTKLILDNLDRNTDSNENKLRSQFFQMDPTVKKVPVQEKKFEKLILSIDEV